MNNAESFRNTILKQPLLGNRSITVQKRGKKNVMLLPNWIKHGVRYIRDRSFICKWHTSSGQKSLQYYY